MGSAPPSARAPLALAAAIATVGVASELAGTRAWLAAEVATGEPALWVAVAMVGIVAAFALLGAWFWRGRELPVLGDSDRAGGWWWCLAIAAAGALPRLVELSLLPYDLDTDSGLNGGMALDLMARDDWTPTAPALGIETLYLYMIAASFKLFGVSVWSLRLPGALLGVATPIAVFAFARHLLGRRVALVACALAASSPWLIVASREARHANWVGLLVPATYAVLLGALARGRRRDYAIAGVLLGLSFHAYSSYRHGIPVAIGLLWLHGRAFAGTVHAAATPGIRWRWLGLGMLVPVVPALPHVLAGAYADWTGLVRDGTVGVWGLAANVLAIPPHVVLLRVFGDPGLGIVFGLLLASALPLLVRWRDPRGLVLAALAVAMIAPPMVAAGDTLAARRYAALVPVLFPLMATALVAIVTAIEPGRVRQAFVAVLALAWLVCGGRTLVELAQSGVSTDPRQHVLRSAIELAQDRDVVIAGGYVGDDPARQFLARCPGMIDPPEGQYAAIGRVERELWFLDEPFVVDVESAGPEPLHQHVAPEFHDTLTFSVGWSIADALAGRPPFAWARCKPAHCGLYVLPVSAARWNARIQAGPRLEGRGVFYVARAGRYAVDRPAACDVEIDGVALGPDTATIPLSCGAHEYSWSGLEPPTTGFLRWVAPSPEVPTAPAPIFRALAEREPVPRAERAMPILDIQVVPVVVASRRVPLADLGDVQDLARELDGRLIVAGSRGMARVTREGAIEASWPWAVELGVPQGPSTTSYRRLASVDVSAAGDVFVARHPHHIYRWVQGRREVGPWSEPAIHPFLDIVGGRNRGEHPIVATTYTWPHCDLAALERSVSVASCLAGFVGHDPVGWLHWFDGWFAPKRGSAYTGLVGDDVRICASASGRIAVCLPTRRMIRFFDSNGHALAFQGDPAAFDAFHLAISAVVWADDGLSFTAVDRDGTLYDVRLSP